MKLIATNCALLVVVVVGFSVLAIMQTRVDAAASGPAAAAAAAKEVESLTGANYITQGSLFPPIKSLLLHTG